MSVATLTVNGVGVGVFLTAKTRYGWPIDQRAIEEEELRSMGVNGRRWRDESYQQVPFEMETLSDFADYDTAIAAARIYRRMKSNIGDLTVTIATTSHTFLKLHILEVAPEIFKGGVYGTGAQGVDGAFINCTWGLVATGMDTLASG